MSKVTGVAEIPKVTLSIANRAHVEEAPRSLAGIIAVP